MWKIFFEYRDKSKCTITGKGKDISLELAVKYQRQYGIDAVNSTYQKYPKKDHEPLKLADKIEQLKREEQQSQRERKRS